jgi:uncharacterized protein YndB with AHSA1/START domain
MWFDVEPSEIEFTETSRFRIENDAIINAAPERVFQIFATGEAQEEWFQDFVANRWTSPEPYGAGSSREVELKMLTVKERFLSWEPGKRLAFTITAITLPLVRRMVEDLQFEPLGDRTRFRWVVHYEPTLVMRAVHPIARAIFGKLFAATISGLTDYAGRNPALR